MKRPSLLKRLLLATPLVLPGCGTGIFIPSIQDVAELACYETQPAEDLDCDGIVRDRDNCPNDYNPTQRDSNGNGIGDACDTNCGNFNTIERCIEGDAWEVDLCNGEKRYLVEECFGNKPICKNMGAYYAECVSNPDITPPSLSPGNIYEDCSYLTRDEVNITADLFSQIATYYPRNFWIEANGHPCDNPTNLSTNVSKSRCITCMESIFDEVGW